MDEQTVLKILEDKKTELQKAFCEVTVQMAQEIETDLTLDQVACALESILSHKDKAAASREKLLGHSKDPKVLSVLPQWYRDETFDLVMT